MCNYNYFKMNLFKKLTHTALICSVLLFAYCGDENSDDVVVDDSTSQTINYYSSGEIISITPLVFFDRYLDVYGIRLIVAGAAGGQDAVPDKWAYKTAQVFKMLMDKEADGIDEVSQENMIKNLLGEVGWHKGVQTGQRIAYGGGD